MSVIIIFILLLLFGCEDESKSYIINPISNTLSYKSNFKSTDPGQNKYSISLLWSNYEDQNYYEFNCYVIPTQEHFLETVIYDTSIQINNLHPGNFYKMTMQASILYLIH